MEIATGRPISISMRKEPMRRVIRSLPDVVEGAGALEDGIAAAPVRPGDLDGPEEHQDEGGEDAVEDEGAGQVDRDHPLVLDDGDVSPEEPTGVGEEDDAD